MNLSHLHYFKKLAELQHYTRAAKELHISQPTLSDAISFLEKEINAPLFYRDGRIVELTAYGAEFYEYVSSALAELDRGISAVQKQKENESAVINIGTTFTVLDDYLQSLTNAYYVERGSYVRFNIFQGFTNGLTQDLHDELFDVVFCGQRQEETEVVYHPILSRELVLCVSDQHPFALKERVSFKELYDKDIISYHRGTPIGEKVHKMLVDHQLKNVQQAYNDDITMASFVSFNENIAALMLDSIGVRLFSNLRVIAVDEVPPEFYWVYFAYHKRNVKPWILDSFVPFVKSYNYQ